MVSARPGARETRGIGEQIRCERVRDPAAGRAAPTVRGPLAGGGPHQVKVVHHQKARRQLPGRTGPHGTLEPATVTWYQEATTYAVMKWPSLGAHSRASVAEALARVTPVLVRNPARPAGPGSAAVQILNWAQQASLPVGCLSEPAVLRTALEALTFRLDGSRAAANTVIRKRAVLHGALGYAAEAGLLPENPLDTIAWQVPRSSAALDPMVVASPAQVSALLDAVARTRPEITAFFGCLYYAALRPEEAVALRLADCDLLSSGWGMLRLASARPRTAAAWTSSGTSHEQRGLKHRLDGSDPDGPGPPVLPAMLRAHHAAYGTAPDGRLFRGARGGPLSGSVYGRAWQSARTVALGPELAASGLARRPYDLRHAAMSFWWLNAGGDPAQIAARAGHSVAVLLTVYSHCIHGQDDLLNQQISRVLGPPQHQFRARPWKASGYTDRATGGA
jgi:integrase